MGNDYVSGTGVPLSFLGGGQVRRGKPRLTCVYRNGDIALVFLVHGEGVPFRAAHRD